MVRSALGQRGTAIGRGPRAGADYVPALSVVAGSLLSLLPIVSATGWWPNFGLLMLLAWRLLRADAWPAWWAAPLGFANDLITGSPIGLSISLWCAIMIAMDILDRRTMWRDYWIEWALASLLILFSEAAEWKVASWMGAPIPFWFMVPPILLSIAAFPIAAWFVARLDAWRLRRR